MSPTACRNGRSFLLYHIPRTNKHLSALTLGIGSSILFLYSLNNLYNYGRKNDIYTELNQEVDSC